MDIDEMERRLAAFIGRQVGSTAVTVTGLRRLPGGASRETWSLDLHYESEGHAVTLPLVLRRDPPGHVIGSHRHEEFALLRAAERAGVPVPHVRWLAEDPDTLEAPFFLMDRIPGETIPRRLLRDAEYAQARQHMPAQLGRIVAAIHQIDRSAHQLDFLPAPAPGTSPAECEIDKHEQTVRAIAPDPHPAIELAVRWLRAHVPGGGECVVVHGDYRIGNVVFGPEGVRAVLDWELAHVGDPMEDLAWLCVRAWRFGNDDLPVGGIGTYDDLFRAYEAAGGRPVDRGRVRFWEVLGNLKWAVLTIRQARTHLDGQVDSIELASLGRRTAEMELELLNLMESAT